LRPREGPRLICTLQEDHVSLPRIALSAVALIVIAFAAAAAAWWFFIRDDAELATNSPEITDSLRATIAAGATPALGATAAPTGPPTAAGSTNGGLAFTIIPDQSQASYFADEELASIGLPSTAHGTTKEIEGTFYLTADGFALDSSRTSAFTVKLGNLKSDKDMRDNRVRQTLNVSQYPTATFTASSVTGVDPSLPADQEHAFTLTGTLDLHGVKKEITWDVKARRDGNLMTGLATVKFRYDDFGMSPPNIGGFVSVQDDVTIQVQIVAQSAAG
jgi:polyisoprenoid-binding protein YceI